MDCYLANFWRATKYNPAAVAMHTDWPVNEADLSSRHQWLVDRVAFRERMKVDPDFYDCKIAGWWVWGLCSWIGSGWCALKDGNAGRGVNRKRPHLGDAGRGVHRQRPHLGDAGQGVHRTLPHLGNAGQGEAIAAYFETLQHRLRGVRVCCGDWMRVLGESPTIKLGVTGVFLDPPYADTADRDDSLYSVDSLTVAHDVRRWAIENGDNPLLRIALCGYEGEHQMPDEWECLAWKAHGGYGSQGDGTKGRENSGRERIWFSPHCLKPMSLFANLGQEGQR